MKLDLKHSLTQLNQIVYKYAELLKLGTCFIFWDFFPSCNNVRGPRSGHTHRADFASWPLALLRLHCHQLALALSVGWIHSHIHIPCPHNGDSGPHRISWFLVYEYCSASWTGWYFFQYIALCNFAKWPGIPCKFNYVSLPKDGKEWIMWWFWHLNEKEWKLILLKLNKTLVIFRREIRILLFWLFNHWNK